MAGNGEAQEDNLLSFNQPHNDQPNGDNAVGLFGMTSVGHASSAKPSQAWSVRKIAVVVSPSECDEAYVNDVASSPSCCGTRAIR